MEKVVKRWIAKVLRVKPISDDSGAVDAEETRIKCLNCDNTFEKFQNKAYCSQLCYQRHKRFKISQIHKPQELSCIVCGKTFVPTSTRNTICSESCRISNKRNYFEKRWKKYREHRKGLKPTRSKCKHCGIEYEVTRPNRLYCSKECRNISRLSLPKEPKLDWVPRLREVTEHDISTSEFSEQIRAYKASGKKIVSLPAITPATHEVNVEGFGVDNDRFEEDLSNFNSRNKERI